GAALLAGRIALVADLAEPVAAAYDQVSGADDAGTAGGARLNYRRTSDETRNRTAKSEAENPAEEQLFTELMNAFTGNRRAEVERGVTLFGPHRDDLELLLGDGPAKGYASHGESWSLALALRLGSYELLKHDAEGTSDWP